MASGDRPASIEGRSVNELLDRLADLLRQRPERLGAFQQALEGATNGEQEQQSPDPRIIPFPGVAGGDSTQGIDGVHRGQNGRSEPS